MAMLRDGDNNAIPVLKIKTALTPVAFTGTAAQSAAISGPAVVRLCATSACHFLVGANPTADANDTYLPANTIDYIVVQDQDKISAIQNASGGNLHISVME